MASFTQTYTIQAPVQKVWKALVDPDVIDEWGGGEANMDPSVGYEFELWGGDVWGKNIEVNPEKLLKQEWFGGEWDQPSIVTFTLTKQKDATELQLIHEQFPEAEQSSLEQGWKDYFVGPMQQFLEKNATPATK